MKKGKIGFFFLFVCVSLQAELAVEKLMEKRTLQQEAKKEEAVEEKAQVEREEKKIEYDMAGRRRPIKT